MVTRDNKFRAINLVEPNMNYNIQNLFIFIQTEPAGECFAGRLEARHLQATSLVAKKSIYYLNLISYAIFREYIGFLGCLNVYRDTSTT